MSEPVAPCDATTALQRLLNHAALPALLPVLPVQAVVRLYQAVGLADAGSLMAVTPLPLLAEVLDEVVWTPDGGRIDTDVLVDWLEVWLGEGDEFTADALAALDEDMLALFFYELLRVQDSHVTAFCRAFQDGFVEDEAGFADDGHLLAPGPFAARFDRFLVTAATEDEWDVVHGVLLALWSEQPERLLTLLERLADTDHRPEGERPRHWLRLDGASARELRRERAGFVPGAAAKAFLALATTQTLDRLLAMDGYDPESERHLRALRAERPSQHHAAHATAPADESPMVDERAADPAALADAPWELLRAAGIVAGQAPIGLLSGPSGADELELARRLRDLGSADALAGSAAELAYLANVLLAAVDLPGQRPEADARDLALATANLGLELIESAGLVVEPGQPPGLVRPFLVGWRALHELPQRLARACSAALASPASQRRLAAQPWLQPQLLASLADLEREARDGRFEAARESLGLLSLALDVQACRAAAHLLNRPSRFPLLLEQGEPDSARWIRGRADLDGLEALFGSLVRPG